MSTVDWQAWLADFNRMLLDRLDLDAHSSFRDPRVTPELVAGKWLGAPPAAESTIAAAEARLGVELPPSYRTFLAASDGFLQPDLIVPRLRSATEVDWYGAENSDGAAIWAESAEGDDPLGRLVDCLQVSDAELAGDAVYLLDPSVRTGDGEWAAYFFASWVPGIVRHALFFLLMQAQRDASRPARPRELTPRPVSARRVFFDTLRGRA